MKNGQYKQSIEIEKRLTALEVKMENLVEEISTIRTNDLAHLDGKIDRLFEKVEGIKLGVPPWIAVLFPIFTALVVFYLTK